MSGPQQKRSQANTAGDDGDASQPTTKLWTALNLPPIIYFSHGALVKWQRERELYEAAVIARCQESSESLAAVMTPVISTIHRRLLKTFCELELKMSVSEMTNDRLITAINQILATMMNDQIPNVHAIMNQHLRMDLRQKDVKARVLNYFDKFDELIEEYGLSVALDGNEKLKCRLLTENLRPSGLKEQVLLYQDLDPTVKLSIPRLFDVIKAEALKNQQSFDLFHSTRDRGSTRTTKTVPPATMEIATTTNCRKEISCSQLEKIDGTNDRCLRSAMLHLLKQACPDVKVERLRKPIDGKAVGGAIVSCVESIRLDLELSTPAGKVRMRKVTCIITEAEEDEFLLDRLTLKALGIDVEGQLSALANKEIVDFDPFESETPMSFDPPDKKKIIARL
ncbi:hypothetical protein PF005_g26231, partial [Phytophthora fragariae]